MGSQQPRARLGLLGTVTVWVLAFLIVASISGTIAHFQGVARDAEFAAQSGSVDMILSGEMESDRASVNGATLSSDAETRETTMRVRVTAKLDAGTRSPDIRITTSSVVCQTPRNWQWSSAGQNELFMVCDRYLSKDQLETSTQGTVEIGD